MNTRVYFEGPSSSVNFAVDDASVTEDGGTQSWRNAADHVIDQLRKSDIHIRWDLTYTKMYVYVLGHVCVHTLYVCAHMSLGHVCINLYVLVVCVGGGEGRGV